MSGELFTPDQAGSILVRLGHVDQLLLEIDQLTRDIGSSFAAKRPDLSTDEVALLQAYVARTREALMAALDTLGIAHPAPDGSVRWSIQTILTFADVTLQEITPSFLRGYGALSDDGAERVPVVVQRLRRLIQDGGALLHEHDPGGLADRIARIPGVPGDILRALDRITVTHHLDALRPLIAAAVDRAEDLVFTVGVFGRVSVGKSSLINALIGSPVLPVGIAPVTAVPIRVEHGTLGVVVNFLSGERTTVSIDTLATYVTEQQNPNNQLGIRAVTVTVPTIAPGIRILDTPGVGSLSATGPAQTFAWLPRCDLGIILVAPGTPVGRDELALVSGLVNAGIACRVILSKADTVADADVATAIHYVNTQLQSVLDTDTAIPITAVSVHPDHPQGLDTIRHDVVEPLATRHVDETRQALARRLQTLVTATRRAMRSGEIRETSPPDVHGADTQDDQDDRMASAHTIRGITDHLSHATSAMLSDAAARVAEAWARGEDGRDAARAAIMSAVGAALAQIREATCTDDIQERLPPLFDPAWLDTMDRLAPPTFAPGPLRIKAAERRLEPLRPALDAALNRYADRLMAWGNMRIPSQSDRLANDSRTTDIDTDVDVPTFEQLQQLVRDMAPQEPASV